MKYMGSKNRISKFIAPILVKELEDTGFNTYIELFVGCANMIDKIPDKYKRIGVDLSGLPT